MASSKDVNSDVPLAKRQRINPTSRGLYCAVAECCSKQADGFSLHTFPSDESNQAKWIQFVKTCREDFGPKYGTPSKYSAICHLHFEQDCYPASFWLKQSFGINTKRFLIPGSIPTIQKPRRADSITTTTTTTSTTTSTSRIHVRPSRPSTSSSSTTTSSHEIPVIHMDHSHSHTAVLTVTTNATTTVTHSVYSSNTTSIVTSVKTPVCSVSLSVLKGVSKVRGAYQKRERQRIINELLTESETTLASNSEVVATEESCQALNYDVEVIDVSHKKAAQVNTSCQTENLFQLQKRNKYVHVQPETREKSVQCNDIKVPKPRMKNIATQCLIECTRKGTREPRLEIQLEKNIDECSESDLEEDKQLIDDEYIPSEDHFSSTENEVESPAKSTARTSYQRSTGNVSDMKKYIVFEDNLLQLFKNCHTCGKMSSYSIGHMKGSMITVIQNCPFCKHSWSWQSQPFVKDIPAGNLLMSASILFSGSLSSKILRFLQHMGVAAISDDTYYAHQTAFLQPSIQSEWRSWQQQYIEQARERGSPLILGGDGRADSPGHCAKFGTYTILDLTLSLVATIETVQSNEVGSSYRMEKEGLVRSNNFFKNAGLHITEIVTDRHPMIIKYVREEMESTKHSIDVWHVAKGLKKKLVKLCKEKDCGLLSEWIKSIVNHLYWVAASTPDANKQLMLEKWQSLAGHLHDQHTHVGHSVFPACIHPPIQGLRKKKWLKEGSKLSVKLLEILQSRQLLKDVCMLSTGPQTSAIEAFHSVVNHFAPKMIGFSYEGMVNRNILAALHFNENTKRKQSQDKTGKERFNLVFKKAKNDFSVQQVKEGQTFVYVERLIERVVGLASSKTTVEMVAVAKARRRAVPPPPPLCSALQKPDKAQAVENLKCRYAERK